MKKVNEEILQQMLEMKKKGVRTIDIAEKFGISRTTVTRRLKKYITPKTKSVISEEVREDIYNDYKSGLKPNKISKKYGYSNSTIKSILARKGVLVNKTYEHLIDTFVKDYTDGYSLHEISTKYGISHQTVAECLYTRRIKMRPARSGNKKFEIDHDYFKELNDKKIYKLGMVFSMGSIAKRQDSSNSLNLSAIVSHKHLVIEAVEEISPRTEESLSFTKDNICKLSIFSQVLSDDLTELGIKKMFPIFETIEKQKIFFEGFFKHCSSVRSNGIYLSFNRLNKEGLINYLKDIGLDIDCLIIERFGVYIIKSEQIERLINVHPYFLDTIKEYCNENGWTQKWSNFIIRFR